MATEAAGNVSETESETSSMMGDAMSSSFETGGILGKPQSPASREQLAKRIDSLVQENRVLKVEVETYKLRNRTLTEENRNLRQASVLIQAKAEQEEEYISNTLLKQIQELKKEKEALALTYEQEEECLTNDLSRKLIQLKGEKAELVSTLKQEQEVMVSRLQKKIKKLEAETTAKHQNLEQLRREKVELENTLEQEQEALVNRLWKRMDKLEQEKRHLQDKLEPTRSAPPSPMDTSGGGHVSTTNDGSASMTQSASADSTTSSVAHPPDLLLSRTPTNDAASLTRHIQNLRNEVARLKQQLKNAQLESTERMQQLAREEQHIREENLRLQRRLQLEMERREQLCRNLSESESSLEIEDERHFNELQSLGAPIPPALPPYRSRTISSPLTSSVSATSGEIASAIALGRSASPAAGAIGSVVANLVNPTTPPPQRCITCGSLLMSCGSTPANTAVSSPANVSEVAAKQQSTGNGSKSYEEGEKVFLRPSNPPTPKSSGSSGAQSSEVGFESPK